MYSILHMFSYAKCKNSHTINYSVMKCSYQGDTLQSVIPIL